MSARQRAPDYRLGADSSDAPPEPPQHAPSHMFAPSSYTPVETSPLASRAADEAGHGLAAFSGGSHGLQGDSYALRDIDNLYNPQIRSPSPVTGDPDGAHDVDDLLPAPIRPRHHQMDSQSSLAPLAANSYHGNTSPPASPGRAVRSGVPAGAGVAAVPSTPYFDAHMPRSSFYQGDGYDYDHNSFADDGDDGAGYRHSSHGDHLAPAAAGAGASIATIRPGSGSGGNYGPVGADAEKSAWLSKQSSNMKRRKRIIWIGVGVLVLGAIIGGVVGGILANKSSSGGGSGGTHSGGLYDLQSTEVQAVLNNKNLHKIFPAMDYTPNYAQYPQCLSPGGGPVQNNVTIDVAIMSQLTPAIRLYGTDCNQTELVIEAINRLQMQDTMKVWLGVYLDTNSTTNTRQLKQLYDIIDKYDQSYFVGAIIGNEVLFSKYMTESELATQVENVRQNFTSRGIDMPVSTADLGDNWTADLASASDIVMANVHPFFAGTTAETSASWAYSFWTGKDVPLTSQKTRTNGNFTYPTQIISEIGWPSQGGNDCGDASSATYGCTSDSDGAVASIDNMNTFMSEWVCQANANGTTYFWFEAFDEPWKHSFDTAHDHWEPYWGLFDSERNLKDGVTIPTCGGKTVDRTY